VLTKYAANVREQISICWTVEAFLISRLRKRLAWEPSAKDVMLWDRLDTDIPNVPSWEKPEVLPVEFAQLRFALTGKYALMTKPRERDVKSPKTCEQIDKP
jgi:hypothetical protein